VLKIIFVLSLQGFFYFYSVFLGNIMTGKSIFPLAVAIATSEFLFLFLDPLNSVKRILFESVLIPIIFF